MKKITLAMVCLAILFPLKAFAEEYIYKRANNPADYVKLEDVKEDKAEELAINHPYKFTEEQMVDMLASLKYSRKALFSDKEKIRNVFEIEYIKKYAPFLVEAFAKATPFQRVTMSVVQKRPLVIIRNDRLTQVQMWISAKELHMDFLKTEVQLVGDYQAHTTGTKLIENAKGLRIELEPQQGQKFSLSSTHELILDLNADWASIADKIEEQDRLAEEAEKSRKQRRKGAGDTLTTTSGPSTTATPTPPLTAKDQKTAEQRLIELKALKDKGLITEQDYNKKKQEILQGL